MGTGRPQDCECRHCDLSCGNDVATADPPTSKHPRVKRVGQKKPERVSWEAMVSASARYVWEFYGTAINETDPIVTLMRDTPRPAESFLQIYNRAYEQGFDGTTNAIQHAKEGTAAAVESARVWTDTLRQRLDLNWIWKTENVAAPETTLLGDGIVTLETTKYMPSMAELWSHIGASRLVQELWGRVPVRVPTRGEFVSAVACVAFSAAICYMVRADIYSYGQRMLGNRLPEVEELKIECLDGDAGLLANVKLIANTSIMRWANRQRQHWAKRCNTAVDLYDYHKRILSVYGHLDLDDFAHSVLSSLGDTRTLARGELYIQLNRHTQAHIKKMIDDGTPLTNRRVLDMRMAMDMVCMDHVQVQISR